MLIQQEDSIMSKYPPNADNPILERNSDDSDTAQKLSKAEQHRANCIFKTQLTEFYDEEIHYCKNNEKKSKFPLQIDMKERP